jgi:hypothetical protein
VLTEDGVRDGGEVLPGLRLPLREVLDRDHARASGGRAGRVAGRTAPRLRCDLVSSDGGGAPA